MADSLNTDQTIIRFTLPYNFPFSHTSTRQSSTNLSPWPRLVGWVHGPSLGHTAAAWAGGLCGTWVEAVVGDGPGWYQVESGSTWWQDSPPPQHLVSRCMPPRRWVTAHLAFVSPSGPAPMLRQPSPPSLTSW